VILTGPALAKMAEEVWGRDWPSILAVKLKKATKTMQRWGKNGVPADERAAIEAAVEDQLALVARYHQELTADTDTF
jgi:hypothetical protein